MDVQTTLLQVRREAWETAGVDLDLFVPQVVTRGRLWNGGRSMKIDESVRTKDEVARW